jgi:hypothetical protein
MAYSKAKLKPYTRMPTSSKFEFVEDNKNEWLKEIAEDRCV